MKLDDSIFGADAHTRLSAREDVAAATDELIRQTQIANGKREVPPIRKGWTCKSRTCVNVLNSQRLFCNGRCAEQYAHQERTTLLGR
jgi:hypothetical protein